MPSHLPSQSTGIYVYEPDNKRPRNDLGNRRLYPSEVTKIRTDLCNTRRQLDDKTQESKILEHNARRERQQREEANAKIEVLQDQLRQARDEQTELEELRNRVQGLRAEEGLEQCLRDTLRESYDSRLQLLAQLDEEKRRARQLQQERDVVIRERQAARDQIQNPDMANVHLRSQLQDAILERDDLADHCQWLRQEIEYFQQQDKDRCDRIRQLESTLEEDNAAFKAIRAELADAKKCTSGLKLRLENSTVDPSVQNKLDEMKAANKSLTKESMKLKKRTTMNDAEKEAKLRRKLDKIKEKKKKIKADLKQSKRSCQKLTAESDSLQAALEKEKEERKKEVDAFEETIKAFSTNSNESEREARLSREVNGLMRDVQYWRHSRDEVHAAYLVLDRHKTEVKVLLRQVQQQLAARITELEDANRRRLDDLTQSNIDYQELVNSSAREQSALEKEITKLLKNTDKKEEKEASLKRRIEQLEGRQHAGYQSPSPSWIDTSSEWDPQEFAQEKSDRWPLKKHRASLEREAEDLRQSGSESESESSEPEAQNSSCSESGSGSESKSSSESESDSGSESDSDGEDE